MQASVLSNINFNQLLNFNHGHKVQVVPPRNLTGQGCMCGCTMRDRPQAVIKRCKLRASLPFQLDILWRIIGLPWVRFQIYHEHTDSMAKHDPKKAKPPTAIWQTQSTGQASSGHTAPADAKSTSNTYLTNCKYLPSAAVLAPSAWQHWVAAIYSKHIHKNNMQLRHTRLKVLQQFFQ